MIIGLCGQAGSGKDTVADFLVRDHGFVKIALADPIKRAAKDWFAFTDRQLWGPSELRNEPDRRYLVSEGYAKAVDEQKRAYTLARQAGDAASAEENLRQARSYAKQAWLTPRQALQIMGTEVGRHCYPDVWVEYAMRVANEILVEGVEYYPTRGTTVEKAEQRALGVVIADVRFRNEVLAIREAGGFVWRIERPMAGLDGGAAQHQSETEQQTIDPRLFASVVLNHGTLEDLERMTGDKVHAAFRVQEELLRDIKK